MGVAPLRARMSGAVRRLTSAWVDMALGSVGRRSEYRHADHERMEDESEGEINQGPDHDRQDVIAPAADRDRRRAGIGASLERNAIEHRPRQNGAEQYDRAEIAVVQEMRERPQLHAHQHRMLEGALDVARDIGGGDEDD